MPTGVITSELRTETVHSTTDLSGAVYKLVNRSTSVDHRVALATGTGSPLYVLIEGGNGSASAPAAGVIVMDGETKVKVGTGGLTTGQYVTSDGSGQGIAASSGQNYVGVAAENAADGDLCRISVSRGIM